MFYILFLIFGIVIGWIVRECKLHQDSDGYLRCIVDQNDHTYYPMLDLNTSMPDILKKPYAIFIIKNDYPQK